MENTSTTRNEAAGSGLTQSIRKFLSDAAVDWRFSPATVAFICVLPFIIALIGASTALMGKATYKWFTAEDGFAETLQVLLYLSSLVLSLIAAYRYWRSGEKLIGVLYVGLAGALIFLIGEELSWGQRIFGWQTAESFAEINKQEETNLHNVYGVGSTFKWIQMLVGAYGTIIPLVVWRWTRLQPYRERLWALVPHYTLIGYFVLLFVWRIYRNLLEPPQDFYFVVSEYNEVLELALAAGFFFFLIFQMRRLSQPKSQTAAS
ncbi:MAG: hypothetical protein R3293_01595 [Candidatus Promineifilaceae bacterium]|nr:hypothetical protein [Candidatus Promineifilaceae bacterium]